MHTRILLCTDLDRTLIPNGPEAESPDARRYFTQLVARDEVTLVYVSGRHKDLIAEAITQYALPLPQHVIGDVGTTIYALEGKSSPADWRPSKAWAEKIAADWAGHRHSDLKKLFGDLSDLQLQENEKQNDHKLSYTVMEDADQKRLDRILSGRLGDRGIRATLVWSVDIPAELGLLDVVPAGATKYHAIDFLRQQLNYFFEDTFFAGDSGNDLDVLISPIPSVLVANAAPDLRKAARKRAVQQGTQDRLYFAKGGFMGMNGNYSAGLLEGLAYFIPQTKAWMRPS